MKALLPAREFAAAWSNVSLASTTLKHQPAISETVCVELYDPSCVRLVATDSAILLHSCVLDITDGEVDEPDIQGDLPEESVVASDADGRMASLATYLLKVTKDDPERTITVEVLDAPDEGEQMSLEGTARRVLVVDADIEKVSLPIIDAQFPDWRKLTFKSRRTDLAAFNVDRIGAFGKLKCAYGPVRFDFAGRNGMAALEADTTPPLRGYIAPVRVADEAPPLLFGEDATHLHVVEDDDG